VTENKLSFSLSLSLSPSFVQERKKPRKSDKNSRQKELAKNKRNEPWVQKIRDNNSQGRSKKNDKNQDKKKLRSVGSLVPWSVDRAASVTWLAILTE